MTSPGARRLAQQLLPIDVDDLPIGEVKTITAGVVTVRHLGVNLPMPRLASYTPVVGHQVVLARAGGRWIILGPLAGIPT